MKYLLLVRYSNGLESYYANDSDKLKEYVQLLKNYKSYDIYELSKVIESVVIAD